jgi:hypothetical protein
MVACMKKEQSELTNASICPKCNNWGFTTIFTNETLHDGTVKPNAVQIKECTCAFGLRNVEL